MESINWSNSGAEILIVEDDQDISNMLARVLGSLGTTTVANSAEEALSVLKNKDWSLLVLDIGLPGMSGLDFLPIAKELNPYMSTLMLTAAATVDAAVGAMRANADDFMTKPFSRVELLEKAAELISASSGRKAKEREVVLAIGAHPDDVEIGCGGILLRSVEQGGAVSILTLTGGEAGGTASQRAEESKQAAEMIPAKLFHRNLRDTSIGDGISTIETIKEVIDIVKPSTIYTHTTKDVHQDHRDVHNATLVAARKVSRIYCYQAPSSTVDFRPTRFVGIDDYLERKIEIISAYVSQVKIRNYLKEDLLYATARYWSRYAQCQYAEPLEVVRESAVRDEVDIATTPADSKTDYVSIDGSA